MNTLHFFNLAFDYLDIDQEITHLIERIPYSIAHYEITNKTINLRIELFDEQN